MNVTERRIMTPVEIGWLAGIIEGEGCISNNAKTAVSVRVSMTDEDVVRRLQFVTSVGTICTVQRRGYKPQWNWSINNRDDVHYVLTLILPIMGQRRSARIQEALERLSHNKGPIVASCGTRSGYMRHWKAGEETCGSCRLAENEYNRARRRRSDVTA